MLKNVIQALPAEDAVVEGEHSSSRHRRSPLFPTSFLF
jgi:hypothetical protein